MAIEIVDLPIENGGSFHSFLYVYQRVSSSKIAGSPGSSCWVHPPMCGRASETCGKTGVGVGAVGAGAGVSPARARRCNPMEATFQPFKKWRNGTNLQKIGKYMVNLV
jgi:hypothetical protein